MFVINYILYPIDCVFQKLQQEIRNLVEVQNRHEQQQSLHSTADPDKLKDHIKKLRASQDLTQQRLTKFETENKELKGWCTD